MKPRTLTEFISFLDDKNELIRITEYVDPVLEIAEITDRVSKQKDGGKALLFENNGTKFPVLINAFGSEKRICYALNVKNLDDVGDQLNDLLTDFTRPKNFFQKLQMIPELNKMAKWFPRTVQIGKPRCQQNVITEPDLSILPVLKCWPADGGRFITLPIVITKDLESNIRNVGMYRMQVFDKDLTGMHWHKHKVGARHYQYYKEHGIKMPVAVILGGDPVYTYSAIAPLPDNFDEFMLAGFLLKQGVQMVKCKTQDIEVPADADIVIEGYVDPQEELILEGPFGDHTGFYSLADMYPGFHVTGITYANDAVYPATIVGIPPQEDAWLGKATERIFLNPIKMSILPEIINMDLPFEGVAHNITLMSIHKQYEGHPVKVMNAVWGAGQMMFNKALMIFDKNQDVHNYSGILKTISSNVEPSEDIYFSSGPADILDHSSEKFGFGSKMMIDATNSRELNQLEISVKHEEILKKPEIKGINMSFAEKQISLLIIAVDKNRKDHISTLTKELIEEKLLVNIRFVLFVDGAVDIYDSSLVSWYVSSNIDPLRDCKIVKSDSSSLVAIDGTRKNYKFDGFEREWPNIVTMDSNTINQIDKIWEKLGISEKISSPSERYFNLVQNEGAINKE